MHHTTSYTSILDLALLEGSSAAEAPKARGPVFRVGDSWHNTELSCAGGRRVVAAIVASGGSVEIVLHDPGFTLALGCSLRGCARADVRAGDYEPHNFANGVALRESGEWLRNGRVVARCPDGYATFAEGDVVQLVVETRRNLSSRVESRMQPTVSLRRVRPIKGGGFRCSLLGAFALGTAGDQLDPYVSLRALDDAQLSLRPRRPPWSTSTAALYPRAFNAVAELVDHAASAALRHAALPRELLQHIFAFAEWLDFFEHDRSQEM